MQSIDTTGTFLLPPQGVTMAADLDALFYFIYSVILFFFALIVVLIILFTIKYKRRGKPGLTSGPTHSRPLEIIWTVIPTILVLIMFGWGFKDFIRLQVMPHESYEINVTARQWQWDIIYAEGLTSVNELVVPVGGLVNLLMSSLEVIHWF